MQRFAAVLAFLAAGAFAAEAEVKAEAEVATEAEQYGPPPSGYGRSPHPQQ